MLVGTSRKSFIGKLLDGAPVDERLVGSLATAAIAIWNGAKIVRVHDVKETVEIVKIISSTSRAVMKLIRSCPCLRRSSLPPDLPSATSR